VSVTKSERTAKAVENQVRAMGCEVFEIGLFKPTATGREPVMLPRTWDVQALLRSIPWLKHQNHDGRNIYIRPKGEHKLSLVDDLTSDRVQHMKAAGFAPALIVQTSPGNFQAWLKHPATLPKDLSTAAARELATKFEGDRGAADWRHFGRLAGFTNRKDKYQGPDGLFPFVLLTEHTGVAYGTGEQFMNGVRSRFEAELVERRKAFSDLPRQVQTTSLKSIEAFRADTRYGGDGTRVDLAYAVYALSHGVNPEVVTAALRSRDLSHKGTERRQEEYVGRTIRKALGAIEFNNRGR
jgi:RepB DNA-primase from phage plasmid